MAGNFDITVFIRYLVRPMANVSKAKRRTAEALRRAIRGIEEARSPGRPHRPLGVPEIDRALPGGGLRLGCIHEVGGDEAATGFCAVLLARAGGGGGDSGERGGSLLWLARGDDLYAPGLVRYGIGAGQLLVVSGLHRQADMLWAMEEALRCRALAGVVAEAEAIGLTAGRRLMLAAEGTGVLGLVLSRGGGGAGAGWGGGGGGGQSLAGHGRPGRGWWGGRSGAEVARRVVALPGWKAGGVDRGVGGGRLDTRGSLAPHRSGCGAREPRRTMLARKCWQLSQDRGRVPRKVSQRVVLTRHLQEVHPVLGVVTPVGNPEFQDGPRGQRPGDDDLFARGR